MTAGALTACSGGTESGQSSSESSSTEVSSNSTNSTDNTESTDSSTDNSTDSSEPEQSAPTEPTVTPINAEPDYEWDKVIALTFDDGPNIGTTNEVLDVLEKHQVVASFFLIGNNITDDSAKSVKRAYDLGCEINNHSKSHGYMDKMTAEEIIEEYSYVDDKVFEITGEHTKFFRPPYIAVGDLMWENIDVPFISGLGCNDWDPNVTVEQRVKVITRSAQDGCIILMHDAQGNSRTVEAIDQIIPALKEQGYKFTTVSGLFEAKGITPVTKMIYSNATQQGMWG
ncbi:MAG: polysaccharide deacetylase family protein [Ruminococcaceae bacterium]|nr:polysaccharide deacetylase family protein [Oscillospiraceae bacterium]